MLPNVAAYRRLPYDEDMKVLGIESSCDETAAAVVEDGARVLSNVIASQVEVHARYGGIVPEVASRQHLLQIGPVIRKAMADAGVSWDDLDAIAVTRGPGLAGSLVVGVSAAKAISLATGLPLTGVNHLEGHIYANWLSGAQPEFPLVCLIASGGHTDLVLMEAHGRVRVLGRTLDDAAGEAFDKAARVLGLGYPGGPAIQKKAEQVGDAITLPRAWLKGTDNFSFSGLKTAVLHAAREQGVYPPADGASANGAVARLAAGFQDAVADVLAGKTVAAAQRLGVKSVALSGGVAANAALRKFIKERSPLPVSIPPPILCTDNAAMIAACAFFRGVESESCSLDFDVAPDLPLGEALAA